MKKTLLTAYLLLSIVAMYGQVDSLASYELGKQGSEFLMDYLGAPTPVKLAVHTIATAIFTFLWVKGHAKRKANKK